ncbi:MAG: hypothetical protein NVSMB4_11920 [Acidimicrobiales bacterium]
MLPALVGAAVAYLAVALTTGTEPILAIGSNPSFGAPELIGALLVGAACGFGARLFMQVMSSGKQFALASNVGIRVAAAGGALSVFALISHEVSGHPVSLGAGFDVITWATDPHRGLWLVTGLFVLRLVATGGTQWGGGTGGTFVPLVVQGALLGRLVQGGLEAVGVSSAASAGNLFILVGMAAFLSAGYRVPLAAVMFVAETTGKPGFIVPGLLACAVAELVMGQRSASPYQQQMRAGHVERRFELPVQRVMRTGASTVGPSATLDDLLHVHFPAARARSIPVVDDEGGYLGVVRLRDVEAIARTERATTMVTAIMTATPAADPTWPLRRALEVMRDAGVQRLAVVGDQRQYLGVLTLSDIAGFDELVDQHRGVAHDGPATDAAAAQAASVLLELPTPPE